MSQPQKVAIITGASRGIGAALVPAYRKLGYAVVAVARSIEDANFQDAGFWKCGGRALGQTDRLNFERGAGGGSGKDDNVEWLAFE